VGILVQEVAHVSRTALVITEESWPRDELVGNDQIMEIGGESQ
jgi:hypothetical protein